MYYFLTQDMEYPNLIDVEGHSHITENYLWTVGDRFSENIPVHTLALNPTHGTVMPDIFDSTIPLMSDRLLKTLYDAGVDNIDVYSVILERSDTGEQWTNYKAINVIGTIDAIDMNESIYEVDFCDIPDFESIVLNEKAIGDAICFRLRQGPDDIVIHEKVASAIRKCDFIAVLVQSIDEYDGD